MPHILNIKESIIVLYNQYSFRFIYISTILLDLHIYHFNCSSLSYKSVSLLLRPHHSVWRTPSLLFSAGLPFEKIFVYFFFLIWNYLYSNQHLGKDNFSWYRIFLLQYYLAILSNIILSFSLASIVSVEKSVVRLIFAPLKIMPFFWLLLRYSFISAVLLWLYLGLLLLFYNLAVLEYVGNCLFNFASVPLSFTFSSYAGYFHYIPNIIF